jgi:sodium-dependent phosphate cotransporter
MYRKRGKLLSALGFLLFLYLFVFSIVLMKDSFSILGKDILEITKTEMTPLRAFGVGWLVTLMMQSSSAATAALIALRSVGILGSGVLIYMILGTRIGTTITALFVALLMHAKRRDFRHGFEIGLANLIYAFPIAIAMFLLELFFGVFSRTGDYFLASGVPFKLNFIDTITSPLVNYLSFLPPMVLMFIAIFLLIASLREMPRYMLSLWGKEYLKKKINKYLGKKHTAFLIGFCITVVLLSTSITITLLVPIIVLRLVNLKKVIPYMIGANVGGVLDVILAGLVIGRVAFSAVFVYVFFSVIGLLWLFNTDLLFNLTKYVSKKTLHISHVRAFLFVLLFILLALILALLF